MRRRTKIVCTLGPAVDSRDHIEDLIRAGMNVARLNCSHGDWEQKARWISWIREIGGADNPIAILADLQGPKFRIGILPDSGLMLRAGEAVTLGKSCQIPIEQEEILRAMSSGDRLLLGDGEIEIKVAKGEYPAFDGKVITGGLLKSRKGVTVVGKGFDVPALTERDKADVIQALKQDVDFIALSYVKSADDIKELRELIASADPTVGICAKIETREAVKDLNAIIAAVDLIMVARGDMGLQMDLEDVPPTQKKIIDRCSRAAIPVITATQMLESMISNPRPTRAEATDVYNAILDGTDAVMLSGETAAGAYPIECVKTMSRIAEAAEDDFDRMKIEQDFKERTRGRIADNEAIAHAVSDISQLIQPAAIVCNSTSGQTPRLVSKFRPETPILCATQSPRTLRRLAVIWGVEATLIDRHGEFAETVDNALAAFVRKRRLKSGDTVVITAGVPIGTPGNTNLVEIMTVK